MEKRLLKIGVHKDLICLKAIQELIDKGHEIVALPEFLLDSDMIVGPNCYRLSAETIDFIEIGMKAARAIKYPSVKKDKKKK